jgi:hypothetical protein
MMLLYCIDRMIGSFVLMLESKVAGENDHMLEDDGGRGVKHVFSERVTHGNTQQRQVSLHSR